jgi:thiamine biosynthesis protein ThiI
MPLKTNENKCFENNCFDSIIIHYDEIGLKGGNRESFERLLVNNIKTKCGALIGSVNREFGQIMINVNEKTDFRVLENIMSCIPGIANFSFAKKCSQDFETLKKEVVSLVRRREFSSFKVDTRRHNKGYKMNSIDMSALLGEAILEEHKAKVRMKDPELIVKVEVTDKKIYASTESITGVGGLPVDPSQKVVVLLSGGFDSPVAAYMMMKRGCEAILVHFQNANQMTTAVKGKIERLAEQLSKYQLKTKLYIVPFEQIQKEIIMKVRADMRMLVYRRFMLKIASRIADIENARFLVVGDSFSQVASQTMRNLEATYKNSTKHILSPLIGMDKKEIIEISKKIGTYEISAQPYGDCCSYFLPKHPMLNADSEMLDAAEREFDVDKLINEAVKNAKKSVF